MHLTGYCSACMISEIVKRPVLPVALLSLLVEWLSTNPALGIVALNYTREKGMLWTSPSKSNTQSPIPGLVRWCSQSVLCNDMDVETSRLWSQLHLCVLQSIALFPTLPSANQLELITLADMNRTIKELHVAIKHYKNTTKSHKNQTNIQTAVDRLVQTLQVSLAKGAFRCSLGR